MHYQAAIFDIDGVVVDSPHERAWREALDELMRGEWRGLAAGSPPAVLSGAVYQAAVAGRPRLEGAAAALAHIGVADPGGDLARRYADRKQRRIEALIAAGAFTAFADAQRLIARLKAAGARLAAASSSRNADAFLARIPAGPGRTLRDLFDANLSGREFPQGKPHPAIFLAAAAALGLPPARCVVFEDAPSGVRAARAAGMACVAVARLGDAAPLRAAGATLVVQSLDQIQASFLLNPLESQPMPLPPFMPYQPTPDPRWLLEFAGFDPATEASVEAICALVNGYQGSRAALEEGHPQARPATLIAGVFNTPAAPQAPELELPIPELVVCPHWSALRITVAGAELRLDTAELLEQRRALDLRQGALLRTWRLRDAHGRVTALSSLRFASLAERRALGQILVVTPENYSGPITIEALVDGRVTNENATHHLAAVGAQGDGPQTAAGPPLVMRTLQSGYTIAVAAHAELLGESDRGGPGESFAGDGHIGRRWLFMAERGRSYGLHKLVALSTSRESADPARGASALIAQLAARGMAGALADHVNEWARRWDMADVIIPGDDELQRQVRFALYHLIGAAGPADEGSSIGARALTGERYRGHVFWDTEIFAWPPLLYTDPATARALLAYRYHTLAGARARAAQLGYRGAMFPWEAADTGAEVTPAFMLSGGRRVPVLTGAEEHHISADVAYAVLQYVQASGDRAFLLGQGAEIVLDVARFWASRAALEGDGRHHIRRVIGPDEYHETVDDNAYTNQLAAHILRRARALADDLTRTAPERWADLAARLGLDAAELARWEQVAAGLVSGYDPQSGLIEQFAGYYGLEPIDLSGHDTSVATVDARLGWHAMQRTQVLKQADVVMLLILLWEQYPPEHHAVNFAYYEPRTSHDSSLSPSLHALFAARLGQVALAERYLRQAALIDLDLRHRGHAGAAGGVHIAALGGIWQALAMGFLGMRPQDAGLRFSPHIPAHWGELRMAITWRGSRLRVTGSAPHGLRVELLAGAPVRVAHGAGAWAEVADRWESAGG